MKRAKKKNPSLDNSGTETKKPISAKTSKELIVITKNSTKKSNAEISAKVSTTAPKAKKPIVANQTPKLKKTKVDTNIVEKKSTPKTKQVKSETTNKNPKLAKKKVEIIVPPIKKPVKKKIKPIGSAVVRGKNGSYDFEVFPLDAELKDGSAIYVISKRITDKRGRGHHKFVCIGQTESLLGDIKKHAKDKCIKQHKANVICLLREENEKHRLKIETDLRQAHSIACNHQSL